MNLRLLAGFGLAACYLAGYAHKPATLSLDDCLAIALSDNPTVKVADMEVERMDYSRKDVFCPRSTSRAAIAAPSKSS